MPTSRWTRSAPRWCHPSGTSVRGSRPGATPARPPAGSSACCAGCSASTRSSRSTGTARRSCARSVARSGPPGSTPSGPHPSTCPPHVRSGTRARGCAGCTAEPMTGPAPAVAALRTAVPAATAGLPDGARGLVAGSGGPDSLALAAATAFVARRSTGASGRGSTGPLLRAGAVVVDHALQPDSAQVAAAAGAACRALGLDPVEVVRVSVAASGGPEAAARDARYAALDETAHRLGAAAVLLGHTLDDQAEQVLLGLARGAGGRSLAGMPARRGLLRRPLLGLRRADTIAACAALGLEPWHDPTNIPTDPGVGPLRSRVRAHVLPVLEHTLGPGVAQALARTADQLREDADALDALAADLLAASLVADDL